MGNGSSASDDLASLAKNIEKGPAPVIPPPKPPPGPPPEPEWGKEEQRFDVEDPKAWEFLAERGYVVISAALSEAEIKAARSELWDAIEEASQTVCRDDPTTWGEGWPGNPANGILASGKVAHSDLLWRIRLAPTVLRAFEQIWSTDQLLTSFDGACAFRPFLHEEWRTLGGWLHVDQGPAKLGLHSVQGLVSLFDASERTGSLVVVPCSHKHHAAITARNHGPRGIDFIRISGDDPLLWDPNAPRPKLVRCRAGDIVLWDSRTIHCNSPALMEDSALQTKKELLRGVAYVCMTPQRWASASVLSSRLHAARRGVGTTHWPHEFHPTVDPDHAPTSWAPREPLDSKRRALVDGGARRNSWLFSSSVAVLVVAYLIATSVTAMRSAAAE